MFYFTATALLIAVGAIALAVAGKPVFLAIGAVGVVAALFGASRARAESSRR